MLKVTNLYNYPIKGLSAQPLQSVELKANSGFPSDRKFALALPTTKFDESNPKPVPKTKFLMLMSHETLARLKTFYDAQTGTFIIEDANGIKQLQANLDTPDGLRDIEAFFYKYMDDQLDAPPRIVSAEQHQFTDVSVVSETMMRAISLLNLASLRDVERATGKSLHPLRFRANLYFDGGAPWQEFDLMDKEIEVGGVPMRIIFRTRRCPATQVNPETALRDIDTPAEIKQHFGHTDLGVYAEVLGDGEVAIGDEITLI